MVSPVVHAVMVRILTSGVFWKNYHRLTFIVHLPLPLQIMGIRFLMKVCPFKTYFYVADARPTSLDVNVFLLV